MLEDSKIHVEVFIASRLLSSELDTFTSAELKERVKLEFHDEREGINTHVSAHCVANAPLNLATGYNYLWRIKHGEYRIFQPNTDKPDPNRVSAPTQPHIEDVPERYHHLLSGMHNGE